VQESPLARVQSALKNQRSKISPASVTPASQLEIRPAPEMVSSGVPAIDALTGGLPRGCLTEVCGPASSGRTTLLLAALAAATRRGEFCVVVDASDALDPQSAAAAGVDLERLLWVRCGEDEPRKSHDSRNGCPISRAPFAREACPELVEWVGKSEVEMGSQATFNFNRNGPRESRQRENGLQENGSRENVSRQSDHRLEQVLRATDLLLESGGFGLIVLDLGDLPPQAARRIPLTTWFRYRRAIEHTPTILLAIEQQAIAGSCSSLLLKLELANSQESTMLPDQSETSRKAAAFISPGRKSGVAEERRNKSRRDGTVPIDGDDTQLAGMNDPCNAPPNVCPAHANLLIGLEITAELIRSRLTRKPAHSIAFATKTAWAG
jgi:RecA/RadA recombinase